MKYTFIVGLLLCLLLVGGAQALLKTTTIDGAYTIDTYTNVTGVSGNTTWTPSGSTTSATYLVVGGAGSGGMPTYTGGGGGAGGVRGSYDVTGGGSALESALSVTPGLPITVTVGFGSGIGGTTGGDSVLGTITANGGGSGGESTTHQDGYNGGSGGGGAYTAITSGLGGDSDFLTPKQGYDGGNQNNAGGNAGAGGGGGASAAGAIGAAIAGNGGNGITSSITGSAVQYAGGGGGATDAGDATKGLGAYGGGDGGYSGAPNGISGVANTGSGGGGAYSGGTPGTGAAGIVIVRYITPLTSSFTSMNISIATNTTAIGWEGLTPFTMQFTNTSTRPPHTSWVWNYTIAGSVHPVTFNQTDYYSPIYTFTEPGNYSIQLNVTGSAGSAISTQATWINITPGLPTIADFVGAPTSGFATTDVNFVDFSTGSYLYSWNWDFGDGITSTERNPTHSYTTTGTFDVSLSVIGSNGTAIKTIPSYITMAVAPNPDVASTLSFQHGSNVITNLTGYTRTVQISNVANASWINGTTLFDTDHIRITSVTANTTTFVSNTITSYSINNVTGTIMFNATNTSGFVAGTTPLSFMDIGMVYDRYSTGSTSAGWGMGLIGNSTYKVQFPVSALIDTPLAYEWETFSDFTISDDTPTSGVTVVSLTPNDHPEAADRFLWNFGDGTTFLDHNGTAVTHVYTGVGIPPIPPFSTSLTAYLSVNTSVTNTTTKTISPVYPAEWVKANFTATNPNVGSAEVVNFIDSSEFQNVTASRIYNWSFGDGLFSSTVGNVQHVYNYYGIYTVRLSVSNIDPILGNSSLTRTDYIQVSVDNTGTKLNVLYPHEVQFSLVDTLGDSLSDVDVAIVMSNSTVGNTNWFTTLFGISPDATPVDTTVMTGTSDDDGSITFPLLSSGKYTMSFNSTMRGISETKTVYPQQANYVIVLHPNAALIPNRNNYINGTLYVTTPNESYADLRFSYTDLSASTMSISFYVDYSNHTRFNTQTFTGAYNTTAYKSVPNVAATSYVFGYYANSSMFGNVSASQGIMMKGVTGKLINLDPCGGYARGWGNQC